LARALAALARGHVTVELAAGRYSLPPLRIASGARLRGAGPDTVLTPATGAADFLRVHGRRVRVSDLALDGLGRVERTIGVAHGSRDIRLSRLALSGMTENGVEAWGAHRDVSVQDSTITGGGRAGAGVLELGSEHSRDMSVVRCLIAGFRAYGIDFAQREYGSRTAALHAVALDNRVEGIQDPSAADGTHEGGIWSGGVAASIVGNRIRDTGWDGIQTVGSSTGVTVVGNEIAGTRVGIYLEHETNRSLIAANRISGVITGINVEWRYDQAGSSDNTFTGNRIEGATESGLFVDVAGDRNRITDNLIAGGGGDAIVLQGASDNLVSGNRVCERGDDHVVRLRSARFEDGTPAHSLRNRIAANRGLRSCAGL
jgi:parallel beta-helix repeat protein